MHFLSKIVTNVVFLFTSSSTEKNNTWECTQVQVGSKIQYRDCYRYIDCGSKKIARLSSIIFGSFSALQAKRVGSLTQFWQYLRFFKNYFLIGTLRFEVSVLNEKYYYQNRLQRFVIKFCYNLSSKYPNEMHLYLISNIKVSVFICRNKNIGQKVVLLISFTF